MRHQLNFLTVCIDVRNCKTTIQYTTPNPLQSHEAVALHSIWSFNSLFLCIKIHSLYILQIDSGSLTLNVWRNWDLDSQTDLCLDPGKVCVFLGANWNALLRIWFTPSKFILITDSDTGFTLIGLIRIHGKRTDDPSLDPQHLFLTIWTVFTYTVQIELVTRDNCCDNIGKCIRPTDCMHYC